MQKIPTMFVRDESRPGHPVIDQITPACQWVLDGEGIATVKYDGTNVKIMGLGLYKRQKPTDRDYDNASYVACVRGNPADRWAWEAFDALVQEGEAPDGIYELVGPKIQRNPHRFDTHLLLQVVPPRDVQLMTNQPLSSRTFEGLRGYLTRYSGYEGIVFHHPDGRMAKIKRRDFGLSWPGRDR